MTNLIYNLEEKKVIIERHNQKVGSFSKVSDEWLFCGGENVLFRVEELKEISARLNYLNNVS